MPTLRYVSIDDLKKIVPDTQLEKLSSADAQGNNFINESVLKFYLANAESQVEGFLEPRYQLPLSSVPYSLKWAILTIAKYYLFIRVGSGASDGIKQEKEGAMSWLRDVRDGEASLGLDDSEESVDKQDLAGGTHGFAVGDVDNEEPEHMVFKPEAENPFLNYE